MAGDSAGGGRRANGVARLNQGVLGRAWVGLAAVLAWAVALAGWPLLAVGQAEGEPGGEVAAAATSEVAVSVLSVGPGGAARSGSWTCVLVEVTEQGTRPRDVVLRVEVQDDDGDEAHYDRVVTTTPGRQRFWVYARAPFWWRGRESVRVTALEALETEDASGLASAGRVLGWGERAGDFEQPWNGLIGVVGPRDLELGQYGLAAGGAGGDDSALWHGVTRVVAGLSVADLPDRWQGLEAFEVLCWAASSGERYDPQELASQPDAAAAVRAWVERGGHLVVVWPTIGGAWSSSGNPLADLMPAATVRREEGVNLEVYRDLLTGSDAVVLPDGQIVHTFEAKEGAAPAEATAVLNGPDGRCLVMRRLVGAGAVTVIGLDAATDRLRGTSAPQVETFWHRVLGRRGEFLSQAELATRPGVGGNVAGFGSSRERRLLDSDLGEQIQRQGSAAGALVLAIVVFALYWLIAGPLGFAILKKSGRVHHAWVGFVLTTGVFTAVAWSGATALRPRRVDARHVALIEQVHGQPTQRARVWSTVLIPRYGDARVEVSEGGDAAPAALASRQGDLLTAWSRYSDRRSETAASFPDNRPYRFDARRPDVTVLPVRSTVKQVRVDWAGEPRWGLPRPAGQVGDLRPAELTLTEDRRLAGVLTHDLPGPLEDVRIVWVTGQQPVRGDRGASMLWEVRSLALDGSRAWAPGERLDLAELTQAEGLRDGALSDLSLFDQIRRLGRPLTQLGGAVPSGDFRTRLWASAFLHVSGPPDPFATGIQSGANVARVSTHLWDLSRWMTQPCVIVTGFVSTDGSSGGVGPAPLSVDGRAVPTSGLTLVRWVYPLPASPPQWRDAGATGGE